MSVGADQGWKQRTQGVVVCLGALLLCACSTGNQLDHVVVANLSQVNDTMPPVSNDVTGLVLELPRLSSQTAEQLLALLPRQQGSGFTPDLSLNHVEAEGKLAVLTPGVDVAVSPITNAAFCLYQLRCFHEAETAMVELQWSGQPPAIGDCYIGLSDYVRGRWNWQYLPVSNVIEVDPSSFSTGEHCGYVVVLLLGSAPASLQEVSVSCTPDGTAPYTLFSPMVDTNTYLIDREGQIVRQWQDAYLAASSVYLLDGLELLRPENTGTNPIKGTGAGGGIKRWNTAGEVVWSVDLGAMGISQHHDIEPMPNGNILVIAWDRLTKAQAVAAGRNPDVTNNAGLNIDSIIEISPTGSADAVVVWEWHLTDHLVQDFDPANDNFGAVADSPGLLNINFTSSTDPDFSHANSIDYSPELDQIAISFRNTSEFYVIDHSTTTEEAAGHTGGRCGRGGDFLYRWGNPANWNAGTTDDRILYGQHDVKWIPEGCPGAGNFLMYNNGDSGPGNNYSRILEIIPPVNPDGTYLLIEGQAYGPESPAWQYVHDPPTAMYSWSMSGAQRLPNGNTTICVAERGWFLEVDPLGAVVWEYYNMLPAASQRFVFRTETYFLFTPWLELVL